MLPETPARAQQELTLSFALGTSLMPVKGLAAPEVGQVYTRAYVICQQIDDPFLHFRVLRGLWTYHLHQGELGQSREIGEEIYRIVQSQSDPGLQLWGDFCLGYATFALGELIPGRSHLEQSLAIGEHVRAYGAATHPVVLRRSILAMALWMLGYPEQSIAQSQQALAVAQDVSHPFSLVRGLVYTAMLHRYQRDIGRVQQYGDVIVAVAHEHGFTQYLAEGWIYQGWRMAMQEQTAEGIPLIEQGLGVLRTADLRYDLTHYLAMLPEALGALGQIEQALATLVEVLDLVDQTGARQEESELYRLKGELLLQQSSDNAAEAESCFHKAIVIARNQHAKSWELRAATSLARLWQSQGKRQEAYDLLASVYEWFTEGLDTADLKDARQLLHRLHLRE